MWGFSFSRAVGMAARAAPFAVLRLLVYFGIGFAYLAAVGAGVVGAALYFAREYIRYLVLPIPALRQLIAGAFVQIGRASCRERV